MQRHDLLQEQTVRDPHLLALRGRRTVAIVSTATTVPRTSPTEISSPAAKTLRAWRPALSSRATPWPPSPKAIASIAIDPGQDDRDEDQQDRGRDGDLGGGGDREDRDDQDLGHLAE